MFWKIFFNNEPLFHFEHSKCYLKISESALAAMMFLG